MTDVKVILQEVTVWPDGTPNHRYIVDATKMWCYGYIRQGEEELIMFSRPLQFSTRDRKFKRLKRL